MSQFRNLIGLQIWGAARALDLQGFQFGEPREVSVTVGPRKGSVKTVGEFALHLQCFWSLSRGGQLLIDSSADNAVASEVVPKLLEEKAHRVESVITDENGGVRIQLSGDLLLEARPFDGDTEESWRLFKPASDERHLVYPSG